MCKSVFNITDLRSALSFIEEGIPDREEYLRRKEYDLNLFQTQQMRSGSRGVLILMDPWIVAPERDNSGYYWPLDMSLKEGKTPGVAGFSWYQEYFWDSEFRVYRMRAYWASPGFVHPAQCDVGGKEKVESTIGILGRNFVTSTFDKLPSVPSSSGHIAVDPALKLFFIQEFIQEWDDYICSRWVWEMRWSINLDSIWHEC